MVESLERWVEGDLRARYSTMRAIAELIGMSESGFTRGVKRGTLSVENLLDLARATDTPPSQVLRLAGKQHVAALIERLYGTGTDALTDSEQSHLEDWRRLKPSARANLEVLITELLAAAGEEPARAKKRKTA